MRVIQITYSAVRGDGVSNCVCYIQNILDSAGIDNYIYARHADVTMCSDRLRTFLFPEEIDLKPDDVIIYHMYTDTLLNMQVERLNNKKILIYQNNTYPVLYRDVNRENMKSCLAGMLDAGETAGRYLKAIVPSHFNKQCLVNMGWNEKDIAVMPGIVMQDRWHNDMCAHDKKNSDITTMLFVGRVVPNKKFEDIIDVFSYYRKKYGDSCQLIFAGNNRMVKNYYDALCKYIQQNHIENVIFTGKVSDEELTDIYNEADVFLCMSEHEGFGMPVIEAMQHNIPVIAYDSTAVRETVSGGGILLDNKDAAVWSEYIYRLKHDAAYRNYITDRQYMHMKELKEDDFEEKFIKILGDVDKIKEYNYTVSKDSRLDIMPESKDYALSDQMIDKLKKLGSTNAIVIYGMGRIGNNLAYEISTRKELRGIKVVYCDNNAVSEHLTILKEEQCLREYPDAEYIITAQLHILEIAFGLNEKNIKKEHIHYFHKDLKEII